MKEIKPKKVCVFLSAQNVAEKYEKPALDLIRLLVQNGYTFVYGGTEKGLMKKAADLVRTEGGRIIAVFSEEFRSLWREDVDEKIECPNIPERKKKIIEISDALVVLPGGTGTLDELMEIVETKKWGSHSKPIVLLNSEHYWDGLISQLLKMRDEGFLNRDIEDLLCIFDNPLGAIKFLKHSLGD